MPLGPITPADLTGTVTATTTPALVLPWTVINARSPSFALWVSNDGPSAVQVQFLCSPDGINPDMDCMQSVTIPAGQSKKIQRDSELHLYWAMNVYTVSGTSVIRWGVTISRNSVQ